MRKKSFIGSCVNNPFKDVNLLMDITQDAKEISKETFLKNCAVPANVKKQIEQYHWDYSFYSWKKGKIYFFVHSAIEYFYK
jgi:homoaconitase/3-isopropylmalate dehydratase large subunit